MKRLPLVLIVGLALWTPLVSGQDEEAAPAEEAAQAEEAPKEEAPPPPPVNLEGDENRRKALDPMQGQPAPALSLTNWLNTEGVTLEGLKGQVVLLDFWGVWCGPCRALVPHTKSLHEQYKDKGLTIIGVHTPSAADQAPAYVEEQGIEYIVGFDMESAIIDAYKVDSYPDIYLIDHEGNLRFADVSNSDTANIDNAVVQLLDERRKALGIEEEVAAPAEAPAEGGAPDAEPAPEAAPADEEREGS